MPCRHRLTQISKAGFGRPSAPIRISTGSPMTGKATTTIGPRRSSGRIMISPPHRPAQVKIDCASDDRVGRKRAHAASVRGLAL
jgi:hypothetical protein